MIMAHPAGKNGSKPLSSVCEGTIIRRVNKVIGIFQSAKRIPVPDGRIIFHRSAILPEVFIDEADRFMSWISARGRNRLGELSHHFINRTILQDAVRRRVFDGCRNMSSIKSEALVISTTSFYAGACKRKTMTYKQIS